MSDRLFDRGDSITCPICAMTSHHPTDVEMGYCGNCHAYTSPVDPVARARRFLREAEITAALDARARGEDRTTR